MMRSKTWLKIRTNKDVDKKERENVDARNQVDSMVFSTEKKS